MTPRNPVRKSSSSLITLMLGAVLSVGALSAALGLGMLPATARAQAGQSADIPLNPEHPDRYVVQRGDTLWDIAALFLRDPWYWPEIWHVNPQVENPHLIYPGDVLRLVYVDGRPQLQLERGPGVDRLSPQVRERPLEEAIPTIPHEAIAAFLSRPAVLTKEQIDSAPYILTSRGQHLAMAAGNTVYVRQMPDPGQGQSYNVIHVGEPLVDPDDDDVLGYEGIYVATGRVTRPGDPVTMTLTESGRETLEGDRLFPAEVSVPLNFIPRAPATAINGQIISVVDGVSMVGQYQVIAMNRGAQHGLEPGHVLAVYQRGEVVKDRVRGGAFGEEVRLPDESAGTLIVFRTFDRVSYGLVMQATSEIRVLDLVRNP